MYSVNICHTGFNNLRRSLNPIGSLASIIAHSRGFSCVAPNRTLSSTGLSEGVHELHKEFLLSLPCDLSYSTLHQWDSKIAAIYLRLNSWWPWFMIQNSEGIFSREMNAVNVSGGKGGEREGAVRAALCVCHCEPLTPHLPQPPIKFTQGRRPSHCIVPGLHQMLWLPALSYSFGEPHSDYTGHADSHQPERVQWPTQRTAYIHYGMTERTALTSWHQAPWMFTSSLCHPMRQHIPYSGTAREGSQCCSIRL